MGTISFLEIFTLFYTIGKSIWNETDTWTLVKKKKLPNFVNEKGIPEFLHSGRWTLDAGLWMLDSGR